MRSASDADSRRLTLVRAQKPGASVDKLARGLRRIYKCLDIAAAAAKLHSVIDGMKHHPAIEATRATRLERAH
jgi:hypothetical protein